MGKQRMIWEGNQEIEEVADKYQLTFLHIDCTSDKKKDKKLPTNAWIVTYLDRKDGSEEFTDHYDIVMGVKMDVFNCYYDKLRDGSRIKNIGWCNGGISPPLFDKKSYLKTSGSGTEKKT